MRERKFALGGGEKGERKAFVRAFSSPVRYETKLRDLCSKTDKKMKGTCRANVSIVVFFHFSYSFGVDSRSIELKNPTSSKCLNKNARFVI